WSLPARDPLRPAGVASWFALWLVAVLPAGLVAQLLTTLQAREALPAAIAGSPALAWGLYLGLWGWTIAVAMRLGWHFGLGRRRLVALGLGLLAIHGVSAWQFPDRPWEDEQAVVEEEAPALALDQETFEAQQTVWREAVQQLAPQREGVVDVYGLVFAPYAPEDVFLRESTMVAEVLAQRFDARGRVLHLVNHPSTAVALPWATPLNLKRAIEAIAQRMDREHDLLVVYLTSHGASNFQLAAAHPPLQVEGISPSELRRALDEAGVRNRVIAISACYSGGWVGPLASDTTLVMTAADAEHTSYGCGKLSELTFFGRAVFDEQLRKTRSFEQAFAAAVPVIKQREEEAGKADGFSNPQIGVGARIRPVLQALEQRLEP
ncbi:MAG TPA: C13 family peptidase, partial [Ramlibacter sp.]|nr:C13 family peptidase [Ramlibacter sp.]